MQAVSIVAPRQSPLRRAVAAVVLFAMMLTAALGELAAASHASVLMIGGVPVAMCGDAPGGDPAGPSKAPGAPACCDHCVLGAPVLPPSALQFVRPDAVRYAAVLEARAGWTPVLSRVRTPRQSQGPPRRA